MSDAAWLLSTWRELAKAEQVMIAQRVFETEDFPQYCSVDQEGNFVYYTISKVEPQTFRSLAALKISVTQTSNGTWRRAITLREGEFFDEFATLVSSLVAAARGSKTEKNALAAQHEAFEQWMAFYRRKSLFTLEIARGLFGELQTARWLHDSRKLEWHEIFSAWQGPLGGAQDFVFGSELAIEVKSIQLTSKFVQISSLDQLNFPGDLHLRVLRLTNFKDHSEGQSLNFALAEIRAEMNSQERSSLQDLLERLHFDSDSEFSAKYFFQIDGVETYDVTDSFPKLTVADVPSAIDKVEYRINLNKIGSFEIREDQS